MYSWDLTKSVSLVNFLIGSHSPPLWSPFRSLKIAHSIMERWNLIAIWIRIRLKATAKEEAIAGIQEDNVVTGDGQEGEGRKDEWYAFPGNVGELVSVVEEASEGL